MLKETLQGRRLRHPLHPIIVHLPIGLWIGSLVFDIAYILGDKKQIFATTSYYCMAIGIVGALLATPPGLAEYIDIPVNTQPRRIATLHFILNLTITFLYVVNFVSRTSPQFTPTQLISPTQFILSLLGIILLSISGYLGGLLVYQYGIGYHREPRQPTSSSQNKAA